MKHICSMLAVNINRKVPTKVAVRRRSSSFRTAKTSGGKVRLVREMAIPTPKAARMFHSGTVAVIVVVWVKSVNAVNGHRTGQIPDDRQLWCAGWTLKRKAKVSLDGPNGKTGSWSSGSRPRKNVSIIYGLFIKVSLHVHKFNENHPRILPVWSRVGPRGVFRREFRDSLPPVQEFRVGT